MDGLCPGMEYSSAHSGSLYCVTTAFFLLKMFENVFSANVYVSYTIFDSRSQNKNPFIEKGHVRENLTLHVYCMF